MPKRSNKRLVSRERSIRYDIDNMTKEEMIEYLKNLNVPTDAKLELSYEEYYPNDISVTAKMIWYEEETGAEYEARISREKSFRDQEFQRYLDLKKKFEGS
jgi:hypothetical protein